MVNSKGCGEYKWGFAERSAALRMLKRQGAQSVAADKAYDTREFVAGCRELGWLGDRCQRLRKRIELIFGWSKDGRPLRKMRLVGFSNAPFMATLTIGCNSLPDGSGTSFPHRGASGTGERSQRETR
jgi:hypothetical protein